MGEPQLREAGDALQALSARVRKIADAVGLRDHTFAVSVDEALPQGVRAVCDCVPGRSYSHIRVNGGFFVLDADDQHEALVHEILHPLLDPLMRHVTDLKGELGRGHYETLVRVFERDLEHVVDRLAGVLAPVLP